MAANKQLMRNSIRIERRVDNIHLVAEAMFTGKSWHYTLQNKKTGEDGVIRPKDFGLSRSHDPYMILARAIAEELYNLTGDEDEGLQND